MAGDRPRPHAPTSLGAVLDALEADHDFLTVDHAFPPDLIETWIHYKHTTRSRPTSCAPHAHEFKLYYDI